MTEQSWRPLFRTPMSTVTKVLRSPAFLRAREQAATTIESPSALHALAAEVERLELSHAPLSAVADRVVATVRLLRATADRLEGRAAPAERVQLGAGSLARERLLVAALHYLVTPDDLVPDFRPGGYVDDVLLLSWVFGAAVSELQPYLDDPEP